MKKHHYHTELTWTGNTGEGTKSYRSYHRNHVIKCPGKQDLHLSSDPSFHGDPSKHNPEELFLASLSGCHMLWFLHLCSANGIVVLDYQDRAQGTMEESKDGSGRFVEVVLRPIVKIQNEVNGDQLSDLHRQANQMCFIANSCNFAVKHEGTFEVVHIN